MADFKRIIQRTTNSERVETGVADLQPNEICIVEDGEELIYKDRNGKYISVSKDKYKVGTIEDLKKSKKYKIGDVVEVLGYYTPGDGGGHPRKKMPQGYIGSDSIIGYDKSIWGIIHFGQVNVSWFGAKGDGLTDDTLAIQNAFSSSAQVINFSIGTYLVTDTLTITGARKTLKGFGIGSSPYRYVYNKIITNSTNTKPILNITGNGTAAYRNGLLIDGIHIEGNGICEGIYFQGTTANFSLVNSSVGLCNKALVFDNALICNFSNLDISSNTTALYFKSDYFNNASFRDCRIYNNKKVIEQSDYTKQFGHGVLFDCCEIEANGYDDYSGDCMQISLGTSTSDSFGIKFSNCWIEGNKGEFILKINAIGDTNSVVILDDNVIFGAKTKTINLTGINKKVKIIGKNSSNFSPITGGSITISNGSLNILMNCVFSSKNLTNGSFINEIGAMSNDGYNTFLNGIDIISNSGGQPTTIRKRNSNPNSLEFTSTADFYFNCSNFYINGVPQSQMFTFDSPYYAMKMKQEGVYEYFIDYMDKKIEYDKLQRELEDQRQLEFEQRESQEQTYEEWLAEQPMMLPLEEEPQPDEKLLEFANKYAY